ncbi:helix-turn-helix domain-containing protein [Amycolatopsis anabasis]|uniref:helix-turn-helix domain-containing protein n=1 Tax=Amycolatopsis anabasis TaxID=1840409 RepID=UPI00131ADE2B|nr:helix-turn-helix transcriptional regulator [Amycolatopsis anabasis]
MAEYEPTVRSRELGDEVRALLEEAGLSGRQAAEALGWSQSDLSRLLHGKRGIKETDIATLLGVCRAKPDRREKILQLCREANKPGWWQQHGSRLPRQLRTLIDHEDNALTIGDYQATLVPGLLQTGDYARALLRDAGAVPQEEIDERVAARLARQNIFGRATPTGYTFFIHEFVLRLPVGGETVMSDQLHHLLRMSVRTNISIRVVPASVGAHAGIAGSFRLMEFATIKPVVYLESETSTLFLESEAEIAAYRRILEVLASTALGEEQSRELIRRVVIELYRDREDRHEHTQMGWDLLA